MSCLRANHITEQHSGLGSAMPPILKYVKIYFMQKGCSIDDAISFYRYYEEKKWTGKKGRPLRNWKTLACDWIWESTQKQRERRFMYEV